MNHEQYTVICQTSKLFKVVLILSKQYQELNHFMAIIIPFNADIFIINKMSTNISPYTIKLKIALFFHLEHFNCIV